MLKSRDSTGRVTLVIFVSLFFFFVLLLYFILLCCSENEMKSKFQQLQSLFEEQLANTENIPQVSCSQYVLVNHHFACEM